MTAPRARRRPAWAALLAIVTLVAASAPAAAQPPAPNAPAQYKKICGDPRLRGRVLAPIPGPGYCGVPAPVELGRAFGVALIPPVTVNCRTARRLADWIERGPAPAAKRELSRTLVAITPSGGYACRPRNNRPGGRLSEHAAGNAMDLSGFILSDGRRVTLTQGWGRGAEGRFLRAGWRAACGLFGTVLGPDYNAMHRNHFHLDTASRAAGPVCR